MKERNDLYYKVSNYMASNSGQDQEVLLFGLRLLVSTLLGYTLLILGAMLANVLHYALIAALTTSIFRVFSGGAHASSQLRCSLIGVIIFIPLGYIAKITFLPTSLVVQTILVTTLFGVYVVWKFVPAETPGKPIKSQIQKDYLRRISLSLIVIWGISALTITLLFDTIPIRNYICSSILGLLWQLISLTPLGYKVVHVLDFALSKISK